METSQNVPDLIAAAQAKATVSTDRILQVREHLEGQTASEAQVEDLRAANVALELAAVDIFTLFEARMQHHFKRGPFSRKLRAALLEAGHTDLAGRFHEYYLAINVLKHGTGASYRELLATPTTLFHVRRTESLNSQDEQAPSSLIDIDVPGFFDRLATTLLEAHQFLENR
ncbi:hypothetical protein shim_27940 [Shimia sp. SK013]|uniref:glutathione S-transferase N-terminal domain-containing protein n=1 Tax=Shimia sp. SK013 TaxID=1389006 RepID=UPI0006B47920|nr:glutathione S-transferase N-terminal domain-containing protein [Shimia sp. SK013]KPA20878.1 hypothetical protein shim_27940 [Shimia sp. SK013]